MFKKILFALLIISTQVIAETTQNPHKNLSQLFGVTNIHQTDFDGVYEVVLENPIIESVFVSEDGRYLIQGNIIDLTNRQQIPVSSKVKQLKKALVDGVADEDKIIFKAQNQKYAVNVFTDVDCPYCKKLHAQMPQLNQLGITVKYLAFPLAQLHPTAQSKMEKIWCAKDRVSAMDEYKKYGTIPDVQPCENPITAQIQIASKLSINGTPAIFLPDGTHIPGYLSAKNLLKRLETTK